MIKYKTLIVIALFCALIMFSWYVYPVIRKNAIVRDYDKLKYDFDQVAQYLINYDYPIIYARKDNIISDDREQTVNSIVSKELFDSEFGRKLEIAGYFKFSKDMGGVYLYKYRDFDCARGLMYYPNGFKNEYNELIKTFEEVRNNWYYFEQR